MDILLSDYIFEVNAIFYFISVDDSTVLCVRVTDFLLTAYLVQIFKWSKSTTRMIIIFVGLEIFVNCHSHSRLSWVKSNSLMNMFFQ